MQQLNQIIIEGKVTDVTENNEWITIEHDSKEGSPVIIHINTKHLDNIKNFDFEGRIIRVVGELVYDDNFDGCIIINAKHLDIHP